MTAYLLTCLSRTNVTFHVSVTASVGVDARLQAALECASCNDAFWQHRLRRYDVQRVTNVRKLRGHVAL